MSTRTKLLYWVLIFALVVPVFLFQTIVTDVLDVSAAWLSGNWSKRVQIDITEAGGGTMGNYTIQLEAYYNCALAVEDGIFEWFTRGGMRYDGSHDRTYVGYYTSGSTVALKFWDEDDKTLSDAISLWTGFGSGDDHCTPSVHVLHNQGDSNDGKILVAVAAHAGVMQTRRSTYSEFDDGVNPEPDTSFDSAVQQAADYAGYSMLYETKDGTVWLIYRHTDTGAGKSVTRYQLSVDGGATWGATTDLMDAGSDIDLYHMADINNSDDEINIMLCFKDDGDTYPGRYRDIYYAKIVTEDESTTTGTTSNKLVDTTANFTTMGVAAGWRVLNKTDLTQANVTAVDDANTLSIDANIMASGEDYIMWHVEGADGSLKEVTLDWSDADHTPDAVYTTDANDWTYLWDIRADSSDEPFLVFLNDIDKAGGSGGDCDIYHAYYSAGWQYDNVTDDIGTGSGRFGTYGYASGAVLDEANPETIMYACVPDGSDLQQLQAYERVGTPPSATWYLADGDNGTTAICGDGIITQASPGDHFRPMVVNDGAGSMTMFFCYTERYTNFTNGTWQSSIFAYPGYNHGKYLNLGKNCRTDFEDLRFTQDDGTTYQPTDSSGCPWFESVEDSWRAKLWINIGTVPASGGTVTTYCYYDNGSATNDNDLDVMTANFLQCSDFNQALDTDRWYERAGAVGISGGYCVLTGTGGTRGVIEYKSTVSSPFEIRSSSYMSSSSDGSTTLLGATEENDWTQNTIRIIPSSTSNRMVFWTEEDDTPEQDNMDNMNTTVERVYACRNLSSSLVHCYYELADFPETLHYNSLNNTHVPDGDMALFLWEGLTATKTGYVNWIFMRPVTNPEPTITVSGTVELVLSISLDIHSFDFGTLHNSETATTGLSYFEVTNGSNQIIDITISGTDMSGVAVTWDLDDNGSAGDRIYALYAGTYDIPSAGYVIISRSASPYDYPIVTRGSPSKDVSQEGSGYDVIVRETTTYNFLVEDLAVSGTYKFGLKLYAPTESMGTVEMTGTVTLTAELAV